MARKVFVINGELHSVRHWGEPAPLAELWRVKLYVDPDTGILRNNVFRQQRLVRDKQKRMQADVELGQHRCVPDGKSQLLCLDGLWYFVTLDHVPEKPEGKVKTKTKQRAAIPIDVIRKKAAWDCPSWKDEKNMPSNQTLFGDWQLYAVAKRQLNSRELKRHGLHNH